MTTAKVFAWLAIAVFAVMSVNAPDAGATVGVDNSTALWLGWMNVSNLPAPDGDGAFQWGSEWGVPDLVATFDDSAASLTLSPNTLVPDSVPDSYWYQGNGGGPGDPGNKSMEANLYIEETGALSGQTVTFTGKVLSNTLTSAHTSIAFIKDFAPDYSSSVVETVALPASGTFTVELATINDPARHVQYGFMTTGENVWATDVGPFGSVLLATIPEPATISLVGLACLAGLGLRRRR